MFRTDSAKVLYVNAQTQAWKYAFKQRKRPGISIQVKRKAL